MASSSATGPQVFINFRGLDLRQGILSFLVPALEREKINVFIDDREERGKHLTNLFLRIEESKLALAIFSDRYSDSKWCLDELAKINGCVKDNKLKVIPVFYKVPVASVRHLTGPFGDQYRKLENKYKQEPERVNSWKDALLSIPEYFAVELSATSDTSDKDFVDKIVKEVQKTLKAVTGQPEAVQDRQQPEAVQIRQKPEAVQIRQPTVNPQGCLEYNLKNLKISGSHNGRYWTFVSISESPNEEAIKVVKMRECYYLDVCGKVDTTKLASGTRYEVVFVVKVEDTMCRWDSPAKAQLMVPDNDLQERDLQFVDLQKNEWIEIQAGVFIAQPHKEQTAFYLYQKNSKLLMTGLIVKGAIIRPVE